MEKREVYCLECDYFGHSKTEHLEQMNREREQDINFERRYYSGEQIPAADFKESDARLEFFGEVVWPEFKRGEDGAQFDFEGEIYHQKGHPIPMQELEEHTIKEGENGTTKQYDT